MFSRRLLLLLLVVVAFNLVAKYVLVKVMGVA